MPALPIPMIVSLILLVMLARATLRAESHWSLLLMIAACAVQGAIMALVHYYGIQALRVVQPVTATLIPPIAWLAFSQAARDPVSLQDYLRHASGPAFALFCVIFAPMTLDFVIPLLFTGYGIAILIALSKGEDSLPHSPLDSGIWPLMTWRIVAMSLLASAVGDVLIAYSFATGGKGIPPIIATIMSSLSLLSLGALSLSNAIESRRTNEPEPPAIPSEIDEERDQTLMASLDRLMSQNQPYLDPDLTLTRLARKMIVPAKQLSIAINRSTGENVSRFINRHRIDHACTLILSGKSVTTAMLDSGFNTKSNFNREFLRLKNQSPSKWLEANSIVLKSD
jgi:AraC-like DNA-binding protein